MTSSLRTLLRYAAYPVLVFGSLAAFWLGVQTRSLPLAALTSALALGSALVIALLELVLPDREGQVSWRTLRTDFLHVLLSGSGVTMLVRALSFGALAAAGAALAARLGVALWPSDWPLPLQLALAALVGELGSYSAHRLMHRYESLWRIHALHHSPPHLYMVASARTHPLNSALVHASQMAPVVLLGAGPEVIAAFSLLTAVVGLLQHCNADLATEWLNGVFATPDLHRTHHSVVLDESNSNFGNNLIVWDWVFGTRLAGARPEAYGVEGVNWPEGYLAQLATPFTYGRLSAAPLASPPQPTPAQPTPAQPTPAQPTPQLAPLRG